MNLLLRFPLVFEAFDLLGERVHLILEAVVALLELFEVVGNCAGLADTKRLAVRDN